jgi:hypothetical protein
VVRDDAGVVTSAVIEDRPTTAEQLDKPPTQDKPPTEAVSVETPVAAGQPDVSAVAPGVSAQPARQRVWSMPTLEATRKRADEFGRVAIRLGAIFGTIVAKLAQIMTGVGAGVVGFGRQVISEVPPSLRLLGALGLCVLLSIAGSVSLDNVLGKSCAVVFVPGFALAFGVVAHRWYSGLGGGPTRRSGVQNPGHSASELERSVEYADAKLAFALNAFGTERHQQAVVALIQAKTATELCFGTARVSGGHGPRPRIKDGSAPNTPRRESVSGVRNS